MAVCSRKKILRAWTNSDFIVSSSFSTPFTVFLSGVFTLGNLKVERVFIGKKQNLLICIHSNRFKQATRRVDCNINLLMWLIFMLLQQLQLWSSRKSHRLWSYQQPRCCGHRSGHLLQNSPLVLDDPTISQTLMPRRDHRPMDALCCRQCGGPPSRIWGHHQHHQRWDRMRQGIQWQGGRPHWLLQEVLWLAWSQLWLQPWLLQPKEFWCFNQPPCCFILISYYLNSKSMWCCLAQSPLCMSYLP